MESRLIGTRIQRIERIYTDLIRFDLFNPRSYTFCDYAKTDLTTFPATSVSRKGRP